MHESAIHDGQIGSARNITSVQLGAFIINPKIYIISYTRFIMKPPKVEARTVCLSVTVTRTLTATVFILTIFDKQRDRDF